MVNRKVVHRTQRTSWHRMNFGCAGDRKGGERRRGSDGREGVPRNNFIVYTIWIVFVLFDSVPLLRWSEEQNVLVFETCARAHQLSQCRPRSVFEEGFKSYFARLGIQETGSSGHHRAISARGKHADARCVRREQGLGPDRLLLRLTRRRRNHFDRNFARSHPHFLHSLVKNPQQAYVKWEPSKEGIGVLGPRSDLLLQLGVNGLDGHQRALELITAHVCGKQTRYFFVNVGFGKQKVQRDSCDYSTSDASEKASCQIPHHAGRRYAGKQANA
mmetsp:Transcript_16484/g.23044  ORF Transcript_16484/g.23044 Transcript_16484/m.23044 type:complete len:273 (-) Transcript_16484:48-866(-)